MSDVYVDIHIHANACSDEGFTFEKLSAWMADNAVERCCVQQFRQTLPRNAAERQHLRDQFAAYAGTIDRFDMLFPDEVTSTAEAVDRLSRMKEDGVVGFGEHYGEGLRIDDPKCMRLYAACAEVGLPVLFHSDSGNNIDAFGLPGLERALQAHPDCSFIGHAPGWWRNISAEPDAGAGASVIPGGAVDRLLTEYPNMYGDLSAGSGAKAIGRDRAYGREFLIRHADQLLFGTDSGPWSEGMRPAPQFELLASLKLPQDVRSKIYRDNAIQLLELRA